MHRVVKFDAVDKHVQGPKLTTAQTVSRIATQKEWEKINAPSAASYTTGQQTGTEAPKFTFAKEKRERSPSPDFKRAIDPDYDAVKKVAPSVGIQPEHKETMSEVLREYEQSRTGPAMYNIEFKLTERRTDTGAV